MKGPFRLGSCKWWPLDSNFPMNTWHYIIIYSVIKYTSYNFILLLLQQQQQQQPASKSYSQTDRRYLIGYCWFGDVVSYRNWYKYLYYIINSGWNVFCYIMSVQCPQLYFVSARPSVNHIGYTSEGLEYIVRFTYYNIIILNFCYIQLSTLLHF